MTQRSTSPLPLSLTVSAAPCFSFGLVLICVRFVRICEATTEAGGVRSRSGASENVGAVMQRAMPGGEQAQETEQKN